MPGGAYIALTGLQTRISQLDRVAADIANATTSGYKGERSSTVSVNRPSFDQLLDAAVDVTDGPRRIDFSAGLITPTGRDLDFAIDGDGFFVVDTPGGPRYTRNGHFNRQADGTLVTSDGHVVQSDGGGPLTLPPDVAITVEDDGTIRAGAATVGKLRTVNFANLDILAREGAALFRAPEGAEPEDVETPLVRGSALEGSNVSVVDRMARLVEVSRGFESLQRGVNVVMNDMHMRAITELGRR